MLDIAVLAIIALSIYSGYAKGCILALLSTCIYLVCILISQESSTLVIAYIKPYVSGDYQVYLTNKLSFLAVLLVSFFITNFLAKLLGLVLLATKIISSSINSYLGILVGAANGVLLVVIVQLFFLPAIKAFMPVSHSVVMQWLLERFPEMFGCITELLACWQPATPI
jgi:uncharacterized membrane protein required for colicin V production